MVRRSLMAPSSLMPVLRLLYFAAVRARRAPLAPSSDGRACAAGLNHGSANFEGSTVLR